MGLNVVPICDSPAGFLVRLLIGFQWDRYGHICTVAQMHTIWLPLFVHYMGPSTNIPPNSNIPICTVLLHFYLWHKEVNSWIITRRTETCESINTCHFYFTICNQSTLKANQKLRQYFKGAIKISRTEVFRDRRKPEAQEFLYTFAKIKFRMHSKYITNTHTSSVACVTIIHNTLHS